MGISFKCEIKGIEKLEKKLNKVVKKLPKTIQERGRNEKGIVVEMIETSSMKVKGRVYADPTEFIRNGQSYLWFEYFGTR